MFPHFILATLHPPSPAHIHTKFPHTCPGRETPAATKAATESVVPAQTTQLAGRPDLRRGGEAATRSMRVACWLTWHGRTPAHSGEGRYLLPAQGQPVSLAPLPHTWEIRYLLPPHTTHIQSHAVVIHPSTGQPGNLPSRPPLPSTLPPQSAPPYLAAAAAVSGPTRLPGASTREGSRCANSCQKGGGEGGTKFTPVS